MQVSDEFEWDSRKSEINRRERGFGFDAAVAVFLDPALLTVDATRDVDGENRQKAVGLIEGRLFTVVYTVRAPVTRIISARRANSQEARAYGKR